MKKVNEGEIRSLAITSAKTYYDYLNHNNKGVERINVHHIKKESNGNYLLSLSKKIFDAEQIFFEIQGVQYTTAEIAVVEYDRDYNLLLAHPQAGWTHLLAFVDADQVVIVSDLKFLVKRVEKWYEKNGEGVLFQRRLPTPNKDADVIPFGEPSFEQKEAIKAIFSSRFSYIWGAPGTGKTRFVLANAILSYLKKGAKVAVIAPTNNALEQSLFGILSILDALHIPREKTLRLGVPSKLFAQRYPECCEISGIQKKLNELHAQKTLCEKKLRVLGLKQSISVFENEIYPQFSTLQMLFETQLVCREELEENEKDWRTKELLYQHTRQETHRCTVELEQINNSQSHPLYFLQKKFLSKKANYLENQKNFLFEQLLQKNSTLEQLEKSKCELEKQKLFLQQKMNSLQEEAALLKAHLMEFSHAAPEIRSVIADIRRENLDSIQVQLNKWLESAHKDLGIIKPEETSFSLRTRISELNAEMEEMEKGSTSQRLRTVKVIAATIDGFINRFDFNPAVENQENNNSLFPEFDHLFLDEAGYCSLIKGATLMACNCPITFLGDHMQLPPVCEMDEKEIAKQQNESVFMWAQSALAIEDLLFYSRDHTYKRYMEGALPQFEKIRKADLTATYRFGEKLADILDKHVYNNGFHSAYGSLPFDISVIPVKKRPGKSKRENPGEAQATANWVERHTPVDYSILAPYKDQIKLLGTCLPQAREQQRIMTIHASQGREWDTVILNVCDTSDKWFTDSQKIESKGLLILNTAISRTKKHLVLVCDTEFWGNMSQQLIYSLIKEATQICM